MTEKRISTTMFSYSTKSEMTTRFSEMLIKEIYSQATKIALDITYYQLQSLSSEEDEMEFDKRPKKHPMEEMTDRFFSNYGRVESKIFITLEDMYKCDKSPVQYLREVEGWPFDKDTPEMLCNFYGVDVFKDTIDYFKRDVETEKFIPMLMDFNEKYGFSSDIVHLHIIPEHNGNREFYYNCFYHMTYICENCPDMGNMLDNINVLMNTLDKIEDVCSPTLKLIEQNDDCNYEIVIHFSVVAIPFLYDKTDEYIQEHFGHKIQWYKDFNAWTSRQMKKTNKK